MAVGFLSLLKRCWKRVVRFADKRDIQKERCSLHGKFCWWNQRHYIWTLFFRPSSL